MQEQLGLPLTVRKQVYGSLFIKGTRSFHWNRLLLADIALFLFTDRGHRVTGHRVTIVVNCVTSFASQREKGELQHKEVVIGLQHFAVLKEL